MLSVATVGRASERGFRESGKRLGQGFWRWRGQRGVWTEAGAMGRGKR